MLDREKLFLQMERLADGGMHGIIPAFSRNTLPFLFISGCRDCKRGGGERDTDIEFEEVALT